MRVCVRMHMHAYIYVRQIHARIHVKYISCIHRCKALSTSFVDSLDTIHVRHAYNAVRGVRAKRGREEVEKGERKWERERGSGRGRELDRRECIRVSVEIRGDNDNTQHHSE